MPIRLRRASTNAGGTCRPSREAGQTGRTDFALLPADTRRCRGGRLVRLPRNLQGCRGGAIEGMLVRVGARQLLLFCRDAPAKSLGGGLPLVVRRAMHDPCGSWRMSMPSALSRASFILLRSEEHTSELQ